MKKCTLLTYFIYLYTVKSSVYITIKSFIATTMYTVLQDCRVGARPAPTI